MALANERARNSEHELQPKPARQFSTLLTRGELEIEPNGHYDSSLLYWKSPAEQLPERSIFEFYVSGATFLTEIKKVLECIILICIYRFLPPPCGINNN